MLIQLEGHGREDLFEDTDLSRTVGWFSSLFPVRLTPHIAPGASLCGIKEQLRAVPNKGIGYGVLRHMADSTFAQQLAAARVTFNYLGQFDGSFNEQQGALFVPSADSVGVALCEDGPLGSTVRCSTASCNWTGVSVARCIRPRPSTPWRVATSRR